MIGVYHGGAGVVGAAQLDARVSLGGKVSGTRVPLLSARLATGLRGVRVEALGPAVNPGIGFLRALSGDAFTWQAPGESVAGESVPVEGLGRGLAHADSGDNAYAAVERLDSLPVGGAAVVQCVEVFNNALAGRDFTAEEAETGTTQYGAVFIKNESGATWSSVKAWVSTTADSGLSVALEAVVDGEVQLPADEVTAPTGIAWTALFNEAGGVEVTNVPAGGYACLRWKRELPAEANATARLRNAVVLQAGGEEVTLGGLCRVEGLAGYVVMAKKDARPTLEDVVWTGVDAGAWSWSSANLTEGTWYVHAVRLGAYGTLGAATEVILTVDADGAVIGNPPKAPEVAGVVSVADGVLVTAVYDPAAESSDEDEIDTLRGNVWEVRTTVDGSDPTTGEASYAGMTATTGEAVESLFEELSPAGLLDGAPVRVAVRVIRATGWVDYEEELAINGTQMVPPNASAKSGTATFTFEDYGTIRLAVLHNLGAGEIGEVALYEGDVGETGTYVRRLSLNQANGFLMTFTRAEMEEYTATPHYIVVEDLGGDDIRVDLVLPGWEGVSSAGPWTEAACTHMVSGVRRVKVQAYAGSEALTFAPVAGESGTEVIDASHDLQLVYEPGSVSLEVDGVLLARAIWRGIGHESNGLYIPTEFEVNVDTYSGPSGDEMAPLAVGVWDGSNKEVLLRVRGTAVAKWDVETMTVSIASGLVSDAGMTRGSYGEEQGVYARWAESLLSVFDPESEGAVAVVSVNTDGQVQLRGKLDFSLDAAAVAAV